MYFGSAFFYGHLLKSLFQKTWKIVLWGLFKPRGFISLRKQTKPPRHNVETPYAARKPYDVVRLQTRIE